MTCIIQSKDVNIFIQPHHFLRQNMFLSVSFFFEQFLLIHLHNHRYTASLRVRDCFPLEKSIDHSKDKSKQRLCTHTGNTTVSGKGTQVFIDYRHISKYASPAHETNINKLFTLPCMCVCIYLLHIVYLKRREKI